MVCYCPIKKVIYIHIPKCAGLTIEKILLDNYGFKHFTYETRPYEFLHDVKGKLGIYKYILKYSKESKIYDLDSFFKFSFVRNPYSRGQSAIRFLYSRSIKHKSMFPSNLREFYAVSKINTYYYMHFNLSQADSLKNLEGVINFNYIGRFENLINDLNFLLFKVLKFPYIKIDEYHENKSNIKELEFNSTSVNSLIKKIHEEDFLNFVYQI
jgi:hypothetical protein